MRRTVHKIIGTGLSAIIAVGIANTERKSPGFNQGISALNLAATVIAGFIFASFPDKDAKKNFRRRGLLDLPRKKSSKFNHRGWLHLLIIPAVIGFILVCVPKIPLAEAVFEYGISGFLRGIFIAWTAHVLTDMFTAKGVPLLFPIVNIPISTAKIRSDVLQYIFALAVLAGAAAVTFGAGSVFGWLNLR